MKSILFAVLLFASFAANALTDAEWNKRFGELNAGVPINAKWADSGQKAYLRQLLQSKPTFYKNPDDYPVSVAPVAPVVVTPAAPVVKQVTNSAAKELVTRIKADIQELEKLMQ